VPARKYQYRRHLPHLQRRKPLFITFRTYQSSVLPAPARDEVFKTCLQGNGVKFDLHAVVVMPDHVHLVLTARSDSDGPFSIPEIMQAIKSTSAHRTNKVLGRSGPVWQEESFDHVPRSSEKLESQILYIINNPVRAGLVRTPEDYPWLWYEIT
jgi:REP-associated tyrosine transposase